MISAKQYFHANIRGQSLENILKHKKQIQEKIDAFENGSISERKWKNENPVNEYLQNINILSLINTYFAEQYQKRIGYGIHGYQKFIQQLKEYSLLNPGIIQSARDLKHKEWTIEEIAECLKITPNEVDLILQLPD